MTPSIRHHASRLRPVATLLITAVAIAGCAKRDDAQVLELRQRVDQLEQRLAAMPAPAAGAAAAGGHASAPHQQPEAAFQAMLAGNAAFCEGTPLKPDLSSARRRSLAAGQQPLAAVVACSDSRCPPEHVFGAGLGEIFVVRCAGDVIDQAAIASLEYAVAHLGVRLIAIVGHEGCGAVKAAIGNAHDTPAISELVAHIRPAITEGPGDPLVRTVAANAVLQRQVLLAGSGLLAGMAHDHEVRVVVGVQQLASGEVLWLDRDGLGPSRMSPPVEVVDKPAPGTAAVAPAQTPPAPAPHGH